MKRHLLRSGNLVCWISDDGSERTCSPSDRAGLGPQWHHVARLYSFRRVEPRGISD